MTDLKTNEAETADQGRVRPLAVLMPYLLRYKLQLMIAVVALFTSAGATLYMPMAVQQMIDFGLTGSDPSYINRSFAGIAAVVVVLAIASATRYFFVMWLGERIVADVRSDVFAHLTELSQAFFDQAKSGEIVSRLTADATQIKSAAGASASIALRNMVMFVGAIALMVYTSPTLSALVLVALPFVVFPLIGFGRLVRRKSRIAQDMLADASAYATEAIGSVRTLQAFTNEQLVANRYADAVRRAFDAAIASTRARAGLTLFSILMIFSSIIAVLWYGAQDVLAGSMSPGTLGQFLLYAVLAAASLGELSQVWGEVSLAAGAAERMSEILRLTPDIKVPETPKALPRPVTGNVAFDQVGFQYAGTVQPVISNLDFKVSSGETVAFVGPSGAGKSTLFSLLLRFYDPQSGRITLEGENIKDLDPADLRRQMSIVPQETVIFAASAMENIRYGRPDATDEEVIEAAKAALAHDFIMRLPHGYESEVGERGVTLSGGQRQRIAIARAILKDAPLLLLDEATSALDAQSETKVQHAIERLMEGRTTLVIAHRLATVQQADRIMVLDGGQIVEQGTHQQLVQAGGLYADLAELQFKRDSLIAAQ